MGRGVLRDVSESRLSGPNVNEEVGSWDTCPFNPGSIGDVARGVVERERTSSSDPGSRGVMGRGIPGT